jgi:hypothetical protein
LITGALWFIAAAAASYHLFLQAKTLTLAEPMGMWETNYVSIAAHWPGQYQWGNFVAGHDNYGPGYPLFCRPFLLVFADVYLAHRVANLVALAAGCGVLWWILRANHCSPAVAAAATVIFYALQEGSYSVQARPDFLVALGMLVTFALGQPGLHARRGAAGLGVVLGLCALGAYLTKPYAAFAWGVVPAYLVVRGHWRRALVVGGVSGAVLAAGVAFYAAFNPYYWFETFTAHLAHTEPDLHWLLSQTRDFGILVAGALAIALAGAVRWLRRGKRADESPDEANARYWGFVALAAAATLAAGPGWHVGAYLTYYFDLLSPGLLVFAAIECSRRAIAFPWRELLLGGNLAVLVLLAPPPPAPDPGWDDLTADVLRQPGRVLVDFIMEPVSRQRHDVMLLGMGTTAFALAEPSRVKGDAAVTVRARREADAYEADLKARVSRGGLPTALYLEYSAMHNAEHPAQPDMVPRGGLTYLLADIVGHYTVERVFKIHPYQFATNLPRQVSANRETLVFKLVLKPARQTRGGGASSVKAED